VSRPVGDLTVSLGWRDEPAYATLPNAAQITVLDRNGEPVVDPRADLSVTVSFGDVTTVRPLLPKQPGVYSADVVPTQPGEYGLHVAGTVAGTAVDVAATCSDATFECVAAADEIEFPAREAQGATPVATRADDSSGLDVLALVALIVSVLAIVLSIVTALAARSRRAESSP
jgi:hypothetical protein